jgi:predicted acylesterase/phospholipase RssA
MGSLVRSGFSVSLAAAIAGLLAVSFSSPLLAQATKYKQDKKGGLTKLPPEKQPDIGPPARTVFTADESLKAVVPGIPGARIFADSESDFLKLVPPSPGPWLVLSGGGEDGAYGAGVITGWTETGKRPEFSVITGVSTGALMAPLAFVGPALDENLRRNFTNITSIDVFSFGGTEEALFDNWPLRRTIERRTTPELVEAIAAEHRRGRRLLIVTTHLDAGRGVLWDIGAIATAGGEKAQKLITDILLASSAVPGIFPPILIETEVDGKKIQEMHADGTITAPFYAGPRSLFSPLNATKIPATDLFVIINNRLDPGFETPDRMAALVLGRALTLALRFGLRTELLRVYEKAKTTGLSFGAAFIGEDFNFPFSGAFDTKYMNALFERGAAEIKAGNAFRGSLPKLDP